MDDKDIQQISDAREHDYQLYIEAYCRNDCPVREVQVRVKDHDRELLAMIGANGLLCPVCGGALALHHVMDTNGRRASEAVAARLSVNAQMYERDQRARNPEQTLVAIPASVLFNNRLPPTPDGWFKK